MTIIKEFIFDNFSGIRILYASGVEQSFLRHSHDCCILGLVLAGKRRIEFIADSIELGVGDIFQIAPYKQHKCIFNAEQENDYIVIAMPIGFFEEYTEDLFVHEEIFDFETKIEDMGLLKLFQQVADIVKSHPVAIKVEEILYELIMRWLGLIRGKMEHVTDIPENLQRGVEYINMHYQEKLMLEDIAAAAYLSPYYFQRQFLKHYGCSPSQYIEKRRLGRVSQLLSGGVKASIAVLDGGFSDQSHFCRVFKKRQGVTSKNYTVVRKE